MRNIVTKSFLTYRDAIVIDRALIENGDVELDENGVPTDLLMALNSMDAMMRVLCEVFVVSIEGIQQPFYDSICDLPEKEAVELRDEIIRRYTELKQGKKKGWRQVPKQRRKK